MKLYLFVCFILFAITTSTYGQFVIPTTGLVTTAYGEGGHTGVDIHKVDEFVHAAGAGKVVWVDYTSGGYGHHVVIYHGGFNGKHVYTLYGHMGDKQTQASYIKVRIGMDVSAGEVIGKQGNSGNTSGATGIHLHFEVRVSDKILVGERNRITWASSRLTDLTIVDPSSYIGLQVKTGTKVVSSMTAQDCNVRTSESKFFPTGSLVNHRGTISRVSGNVRRQYSEAAYLSYFPGFCSTIIAADPSDFENRYPKGSDMPAFPAKRLITYSGGPVFYVDGDGKAHALTSDAVMFDLGLARDFVGLQVLSQAEVQSLISAESPEWDSPFNDGVLIRGIIDQTVYVITGGRKRGITAEAYRIRGDRDRDVITIPDDIVSSIDSFTPPITRDTVTGGDSTLRVMALTEGASFKEQLAPGGIVSLFGSGLSFDTASAANLPLPTVLANVTGTIKDALNKTYPLSFFYVSPGQVNALISDDAAEGIASLEIQAPNGTKHRATAYIQKIGGGIFTITSNGSGIAAAQGVRVINNIQTRFSIATTSNQPIPIDVQTGTVFLELYCTGVKRGSQKKCEVDGVPVTVTYLGSQPHFAGLDQINIQLSPTLAGRGLVDLEVIVDGKPLNRVQLFIQ